MNKFTIKYLLSSLFLTCSLIVEAEDIPQISLPPSPDAAALGKYGQFPVTLYNGLVDISVPIYSIKLRQFELPISLTYHASGIKVDEISSSVGLGWALQAGGVITRSVNGLPDACFGSSMSGIMTQDQVRTFSDENFIEYLRGRYWSEVNNSDDSESDVYYYNVGGLSGSFRFDIHGDLIQIPLTNNKIEFDGTNFTITGNDGTIYGFQAIETSKCHVNSSNLPYTSSWYLSFIHTTDNQEITFEYDSDLTEYIDPYEVSSMTISHGNFHAQSVDVRQYNHLSGTTLFIKRINFPGGTVRFSYANDREDCRNYRLERIDITNNPSYTLEHGYFYDHECKRLRLDKVKLSADGNESLGQYCFDYNTEVNLPPYLSNNTQYNRLHRGQDLWGYYNGVTTNNHMLVCNRSQNYEIHIADADRSVNPFYSEANILKKITYPTGGSSVFIYEGNKSVTGTLIGGLRIKNVISYNGGEIPSTVKSYEYGNGVSNRYVNDFLADCSYTQVLHFGDNIYINNTGHSTTDPFDIRDYYVANPPVPLSYSGGSPVYYRSVTEYDGYPRNCNGKTEYNYIYNGPDIDYVYSPGYFNLPSPSTFGFNPMLIFMPRFTYRYIDKGWTRGYLASTSVYEKKNDVFVLKKKTIYDYSTFNRQCSIVGFHAFANIWPTIPMFVMNGNTSPNSRLLFQYTDVIAETGLLKLTEVRDTIYEDSKKLATTTRHFYDRLNKQFEITRTYQTNSDGSVIKKSYNYPKDYTSGIYALMAEKNMLNTVVETKDSVNNKLVKSFKVTYGNWNNSFIAPSSYSEKFSGSYRTLLQINNYGIGGNPMHVVNENGENIVYLWGYGYQYPIAEIRNATYLDVVNAIAGGENTINTLASSRTPDMTVVDALRQSLPNALVTTCTYKPSVGILTKTEPNGITTYYLYDNAGRLTRVLNNRRQAIKGYEYKYAN